MLRAILPPYFGGVLATVVSGILFWAVIKFGLKGHISDQYRTDLSEGFPWWFVMLMGLIGGSVNILFLLFKDAWPTHAAFEALAIAMLGPMLGVIILSVSGYLLLSPLGLRGFGQKFGIWMGVFFGMEAAQQLMSHLGLCL